MRYTTKDRLLLAGIAGTALTAPVPLITCVTEGRAGASVLLPLAMAATAIGSAVALSVHQDRTADRTANTAEDTVRSGPDLPDLNALYAAQQAEKTAA